MQYVWPVLLVACRALYLAYSVWCMLFPLAALAFLYALWQEPLLLGVGFAAFAGALLALVYARRTPGDPNPFQSAFLSWFGTLRLFRNHRASDMSKVALPSGYLVENPQAYRIGGADLATIQQRIQPGDILLRGFDGYLDGFMIRHASVCSAKGFRPGWFTHAALYVGVLDGADRKHVPAAFQHDAGYFQEGATQIIHAMAKGVHTQDLLTFCRCDYLCILRVPAQATPDAHGAAAGASVDVVAARHAAKISALQKIGEKYDFDASDTSAFHRFSCSELVYYCYRGIRSALHLTPQIHALYPFSPFNTRWCILPRKTIVPDDFYALTSQGAMACVWQDTRSANR